MTSAAVLTCKLFSKASTSVKAAGPTVEAINRALNTTATPKYVFDADEHAGFHFLSSEDMILEAELRQQHRDMQRTVDEECAAHWTYPVSYVSEQELIRQKECQDKLQAETAQIVNDCALHWTYPISYVSKEEMALRRAEQDKEVEVQHHAWE